LREPEAGNCRLPGPGTERRPVQLEPGDDDEDAGVDRTSRPHQHGDQEGASDRAHDVRGGQHRDSGDPPDRRTCGRNAEEHVRPCSRERREREPAEIDEPVTRWDEHGQILEAVAVETPDQGADNLPERGDSDNRERLETDRGRVKGEEPCEHRDGQSAERQLPRSSDLSVEPEPANGPRGDDEEDEDRPAHYRIFADGPVIGSRPPRRRSRRR